MFLEGVQILGIWTSNLAGCLASWLSVCSACLSFCSGWLAGCLAGWLSVLAGWLAVWLAAKACKRGSVLKLTEKGKFFFPVV